MPALANPVIVIPGVTATYLHDYYPLSPETVWSVLTRDFERAKLHPDDLRFESREPALMRHGQLYQIAYGELIEELRFNLTPTPDEPVPVFSFGYDWRQPLSVVEHQLAAFIDEVIARTRLLRHYARAGYGEDARVNLLGHSMGGLLIAGYVERFGAAGIGKVATLASPFQGSFEAMVKITTGTADLGGSVPSSREREAARVTPALYHLLPDFDTGMTAEAGLPESTFDADLWQPSIIDTVASYVAQHAVEPGNKTQQRQRAEQLFGAMLRAAANHRARLAGLELAEKGLAPEDWLCVVGVGAQTRVRMRVEKRYGKPYFRLSSDDRMDHWGKADADQRLTGDGTVHFRGAVPTFLPYESLVCVTPDDYGYWEIGDRVTTRIGGFHGILPNMDMLHRLVVRHFTGRGDPKRNTWGRPPPGIDKRDWTPPLTLSPK
ncbi:MAG TPA: hypothetical protein VMM59_08340 [Thermohalobaculum sp.]|nr:hypothetical protein [Thermohalobaculum sp.]